ncbi:glycosyltransferase [Hymenobacter sp. UYCo722]|uniref:glycosyltransferase n=1 Tax=Hymenobacter sp. UYCo722 TaxID=3156335 RepID=UPI0033977EE4
MTYNHEKFVRQAIEGVLEQNCEFPIEMIIGDDCSTDDTRQIIAEYAASHPHIIRPIYHEKNVGAAINQRECMAACTGEFVAVLEGDDYWIDPDKLRLQVAALESRPGYALCIHDAETFNDHDNSKEWTFGEEFPHILPAAGGEPRTFTQLDIARYGWFIPTASMLMRATSIPRPLPFWFDGIYSGDYALQLLSTKQGPAIYLPRVMARYRIHAQSKGTTMAQSESKFKRRVFEAKMFRQHMFKPQDRKHADIYLAMQYEGYARFLGSQGRRWEQLKFHTLAQCYNWQRIPLYIERRLQTKAAKN